MKNKSIKIKFMTPEEFTARFRHRLKGALIHKARSLQPPELKIWRSVNDFQKFMNGQKYAILSAIARHQPESIYELAKILNRPHQNVARDCEALRTKGFIRFKISKSRRRTKAPRLIFDYSVIEVHIPQVAYSVDLTG